MISLIFLKVYIRPGLLLLGLFVLSACANKSQDFAKYINSPDHKAWADSTNIPAYGYSWNASTVMEAKRRAVNECEKHSWGCKITNIDGLPSYEWYKQQSEAIRERTWQRDRDATEASEPIEATPPKKPNQIAKTTLEPEPKDKSLGTGFFVGKSGYLITNHHIVADCSSIDVQNQGYKSKARLFGSDTKNDLVVLIVEDKNVSCCQIVGKKI